MLRSSTVTSENGGTLWNFSIHFPRPCRRRVASASWREMGSVRQVPSNGDAAGVLDVAGASEMPLEVLARSSGASAAGMESSEPQPTRSSDETATATAMDRQLRWVVARKTDHSLITL